MKRLLFLAAFLMTISATAQTQTYKVEVTDNTQIQLLSAEYSLYEKEQREMQAAKNLETVQNTYRTFNTILMTAYRQTNNAELLKRIEAARKMNDKLAAIKNTNRYNKYLPKVQSEILMIQAIASK